MKKFLSFFVAALLIVSLLSVTAFAAGTNVYGASVEADKGATVKVPVKISGNTGFDAAKMSVSVSEPLTFVGFEKTNMFKGEDYGTVINHASSDPVAENGTLFYVVVKVAADAKPGKYPVNLSLSYMTKIDVSLGATVSNGLVVIPEPATEAPTHVHTAGDPFIEVEKQPTCTETGVQYKIVKCTVCGEVISKDKETIPALGHKYGEEPIKVVAPTCTEQGYSVYACTVCGHEKNDDFVAAAGHKYLNDSNDYKYYNKHYAKHWHICWVCAFGDGAELDPQEAFHGVASHKYDIEDGDRLYCVCGRSIEKGLDPQPDDGDITGLFVMGAVALISMAAAAAYVCKRKFAK